MGRPKEEILEQIKDLASKGYILQEISKTIPEISRETIKSWCTKYSIPLQSIKDRLQDSQQSIIDLYIQGMTVSEIRQRGFAYETIKAAVATAGLKWKERSGSVSTHILSPEEALSKLPDNSEYKFLYHEKVRQTRYYWFEDGKGNQFRKTASHIHQGSPYLSGRKRRYTEQDYINRCSAFNHTLIQFTPGNIKEVPVTIQCDKGHTHTYKIAHNIFMMPITCASCNNNGVSREETRMKDLLIAAGYNVEKFYIPTTGSGRKPEIDLYLPEYKIGIEYHGLYHHSEPAFLKRMEIAIEKFKERYPEDTDEYKDYIKQLNKDWPSQSMSLDELRIFLVHPKKAHLTKKIMSQKLGIKLIQVFADELTLRQDQVLSYIDSLCKKKPVLYARKLDIKHISTTEALLYINTHHIQPLSQPPLVSVGLFNGDVLVGVITAADHHRDRRTDTLVINRMCFGDYTVVGGASRLTSAIKQWAKDNQYSKIITWSDKRWSDGDVYQKIGFALEKDDKPDYSYTKKNVRYSKQSKQKKHLRKQKAIGNTETEMASSLGYSRIWDCGKQTWVLKI